MQVIQVRDNDWQTQLGSLAGIIGGMMFNNRLDRGALREANNQTQKEELARQQGFTSGLTNLQGLYQNPDYEKNKDLQSQAMNIQADLAGRGYRNAFGLNTNTIGGALTNNSGAIISKDMVKLTKVCEYTTKTTKISLTIGNLTVV